MLKILEKIMIWWALGTVILIFKTFENLCLRFKSAIKNPKILKFCCFWWAPSTVSKCFRKSWFLFRRQMPTVFLIQRSREIRHFQSFLYKTKDSRLKILCSIPDKTAHRTNPHLLQDSNDSTKCLSGASIWDKTVKNTPRYYKSCDFPERHGG